MIPLPDKVHIYERSDPSNSWDVPGVIVAAKASLATGAYNRIYFEQTYSLIVEPIPGYDTQNGGKYRCLAYGVTWDITYVPQIRGRQGIAHHWTLELRDIRQA